MNVTRFAVKGLNHTSKLNSLLRRGFKPFDVISCPRHFLFSVDSAREKAVIGYFEELCYDYEIISRRGIRHAVNSLLSSKGFFIGIIFSLALLIVSSLFLMDIKVSGNDRVEESVIAEAAESAGLKRFTMIYGVDKKSVENSVLEVDGISSVSLELKGVRAYLHVHEEFPPSHIIDSTSREPVMAAYDSIVTRIVTLSGTAIVKPGDTVLSGQTLIAPYIINGDEENEIQVPVKASGMVYGRVWYRESKTIGKEEIILERTGEYIETATPSYILKGKSNPLVPYTKYEIEEYNVTYNAVFPLTVTYTRYYELYETTVIRDVERDTARIITEAYLRLRERPPNDAEVVRYWSIVKEVDNLILIDVYLETEQRIDDGGTLGEDNH
jgi:similar to stage IV sporulation protein